MIEHLSYSSITSYLTCSRNWRYHYVDKLPEATTPALMFGSAIHNTVEALITANTQGENAVNPVESFTKSFAEKIAETEIIDWQDTSEGDQLRLATKILNTPEIVSELNALRAKVDSDGVPMIERKVELSVPGVDVPVIGYIDIILDDGTPADFKTASRAWSQLQADNSMQSLFYIAALNQAGEDVNWKFKHLVITKTLSPKFQCLEHSHAPKEIFFLFDLIQSVWSGIQNEVFVPNPDAWKCSPCWCSFFNNCRGK